MPHSKHPRLCVSAGSTTGACVCDLCISDANCCQRRDNEDCFGAFHELFDLVCTD